MGYIKRFQDISMNKILKKIKANDMVSNDFLGLECINNPNPTVESITQAYLQQYERFESKPIYLDSALIYLNNNVTIWNRYWL